MRKIKTIKILIDMDNTVNKMTDHFKIYLRRMGLTIEGDIDQYEIYRYIQGPGLDSDHQRKAIMSNIFCTPGFWISCLPEKGIEENIKKLHNVYDVYIATIPWASSKTCKEEKIQWVHNYLPFINTNTNMIFQIDKWNMDAHYIIDDKPEILERCKGKMITIAFDQKYNRSVKTDFRIKKWNEIKFLKCFRSVI